MCNKAVCRDPWLFEYVPDWLVTQQQTKLWHNDYCNDDRLIEWYERKQKAQIEKELMPIA